MFYVSNQEADVGEERCVGTRVSCSKCYKKRGDFNHLKFRDCEKFFIYHKLKCKDKKCANESQVIVKDKIDIQHLRESNYVEREIACFNREEKEKINRQRFTFFMVVIYSIASVCGALYVLGWFIFSGDRVLWLFLSLLSFLIAMDLTPYLRERLNISKHSPMRKKVQVVIYFLRFIIFGAIAFTNAMYIDGFEVSFVDSRMWIALTKAIEPAIIASLLFTAFINLIKKK